MIQPRSLLRLTTVILHFGLLVTTGSVTRHLGTNQYQMYLLAEIYISGPL